MRSLPTLVSIHAPARGRIRTVDADHRTQDCVSIHAPARGRMRASLPSIRQDKVSIHAPARGRIAPHRLLWALLCVSIHAPARGRIRQRRVSTRWSASFNPRPRAGANAALFQSRQGDSTVSIHAPARGRISVIPITIVDAGRVSIHAPARGRIGGSCMNKSEIRLFQSTPPRGGESLPT